MAQVILKKSSVAARVPVAGDLVYGELAINYQDGLLYYKKADNTIGSIGGTSNVISVSTTTDAFRITQTGTGNALVVEDAANPDATPFIVDGNGKVLIARSIASAIAGGALQITVQGATLPAVLTNTGSTAYRPHWTLAVSDTEVAAIGTINTTLALYTAGSSRLAIDLNGNIGFGTNTPSALAHIAKSEITAYSGTATDGQLALGSTMLIQQTGGSNTAIAQLVFQPRSGYAYNRIVSSGGSAPFMTLVVNNTERVRVTSAGGVSFGSTGTAYGTAGQILQSNGNAPPTWVTSSGGGGGTTTTGTALAYTRTSYVATANQTTFDASYTVGYVEVFYNGVLLNTSDYVATDSTSITLNTAAALNDIVEIIAYPTAVTPTPLFVDIVKQSSTVTVAGSTTYTIAYTAGYLDVYVNGIKLAAADFTATNGTTVVIPDLLVDDVVELISTATSAMSVAGTGLAITSGILTLNSAATATANTIVLRDGTGQVLTTGIKFSDNSIQTTASVPGVTTGKSIAMAIIFGG